MKHRLLLICMILLLAVSGAYAEPAAAPSPTVNDMGLEMMGCKIRYPQLTGLADPAVQSSINAAIMEKGRINDRLSRMAALLSSPVKLNVSYTYMLSGDILSCAILADGAVETSRATQVWTAMTFDLRTGREITFADLFRDADAATAFIEAYLSEQVLPDLSAHVDAGSLTPLPENFTISPTGLTLYYDIDAFRTLSDKAGAVTILWTELHEHLRLGQTDVLTNIGADSHLALGDEGKSRIPEMIQAGGFAGIPAAIGQPMQDLIDRYALLTDPDIYEGGRMISLEDSAFRQVWLLTDALTEDFDQSVVQSIRADRLNYYGLCTGVTTVDQWRHCLGNPDTTLTVDATRAEGWRIVPGTSDYYTFGGYRLRLHADENGVLRSVFLSR